MDRDKLDSIYQYLSKAEGSKRNEILALLRTRVAGGLEAQHHGHEAGKYWMPLNSDLEAVANANPKDAFDFALETLRLDEGKNDPDQYRSWLKGNALIILSNPKVKPLLIADLGSENSQVSPAIEAFLNFQTPDAVQTKDDLSDYPQSFNLVMSLVILNDLKAQNIKSIAGLETKADQLLKNKKVKHLINLYHDISDDKELVEPLFRAIRVVLKSEDDTVVLKQLYPEDAENYFKLVDSDSAHLSQHGDDTASKYPSVEAALESIVHPRNPDKYRFGIWDGDIMVGSDNLTPKERNRAELGSWIAKEYIGNRYAGRARKLLVDFAFNQLHLDEVFCEVTIGNEPSRKSVERSGFTLSGEHDGKWTFVLKRSN